MVITEQNLGLIVRGLPKNAGVFAGYIQKFSVMYQVNTPLRLAHFIAQVSHESGNFSSMIENLNYSATGLANTWPRLFSNRKVRPHIPNSTAIKYARNAIAIANLAYSNRYGNGDEKSGDGWKFRGRGLIQTTFKSNYEMTSLEIFKDKNVLLRNPDLLATPEYAVQSAFIYWKNRKINDIADKGATAEIVKQVTSRINPALLHLKERTDAFNHCYKYFTNEFGVK